MAAHGGPGRTARGRRAGRAAPAAGEATASFETGSSGGEGAPQGAFLNLPPLGGAIDPHMPGVISTTPASYTAAWRNPAFSQSSLSHSIDLAAPSGLLFATATAHGARPGHHPEHGAMPLVARQVRSDSQQDGVADEVEDPRPLQALNASSRMPPSKATLARREPSKAARGVAPSSPLTPGGPRVPGGPLAQRLRKRIVRPVSASVGIIVQPDRQSDQDPDAPAAADASLQAPADAPTRSPGDPGAAPGANALPYRAPSPAALPTTSAPALQRDKGLVPPSTPTLDQSRPLASPALPSRAPSPTPASLGEAAGNPALAPVASPPSAPVREPVRSISAVRGPVPRIATLTQSPRPLIPPVVARSVSASRESPPADQTLAEPSPVGGGSGSVDATTIPSPQDRPVPRFKIQREKLGAPSRLGLGAPLTLVSAPQENNQAQTEDPGVELPGEPATLDLATPGPATTSGDDDRGAQAPTVATPSLPNVAAPSLPNAGPVASAQGPTAPAAAPVDQPTLGHEATTMSSMARDPFTAEASVLAAEEAAPVQRLEVAQVTRDDQRSHPGTEPAVDHPARPNAPTAKATKANAPTAEVPTGNAPTAEATTSLPLLQPAAGHPASIPNPPDSPSSWAEPTPTSILTGQRETADRPSDGPAARATAVDPPTLGHEATTMSSMARSPVTAEASVLAAEESTPVQRLEIAQVTRGDQPSQPGTDPAVGHPARPNAPTGNAPTSLPLLPPTAANPASKRNQSDRPGSSAEPNPTAPLTGQRAIADRASDAPAARATAVDRRALGNGESALDHPTSLNRPTVPIQRTVADPLAVADPPTLASSPTVTNQPTVVGPPAVADPPTPPVQRIVAGPPAVADPPTLPVQRTVADPPTVSELPLAQDSAAGPPSILDRPSPASAAVEPTVPAVLTGDLTSVGRPMPGPGVPTVQAANLDLPLPTSTAPLAATGDHPDQKSAPSLPDRALTSQRPLPMQRSSTTSTKPKGPAGASEQAPLPQRTPLASAAQPAGVDGGPGRALPDYSMQAPAASAERPLLPARVQRMVGGPTGAGLGKAAGWGTRMSAVPPATGFAGQRSAGQLRAPSAGLGGSSRPNRIGSNDRPAPGPPAPGTPRTDGIGGSGIAPAGGILLAQRTLEATAAIASAQSMPLAVPATLHPPAWPVRPEPGLAALAKPAPVQRTPVQRTPSPPTPSPPTPSPRGSQVRLTAQRDPESEESGTGGGSLAGGLGSVGSSALGATSTEAALPGPADRDFDEVARRLYPRLRAMLAAELRLDRERTGRVTDLRR